MAALAHAGSVVVALPNVHETFQASNIDALYPDHLHVSHAWTWETTQLVPEGHFDPRTVWRIPKPPVNRYSKFQQVQESQHCDLVVAAGVNLCSLLRRWVRTYPSDALLRLMHELCPSTVMNQLPLKILGLADGGMTQKGVLVEEGANVVFVGVVVGDGYCLR
jgi:hypothetical protein